MNRLDRYTLPAWTQRDTYRQPGMALQLPYLYELNYAKSQFFSIITYNYIIFL